MIAPVYQAIEMAKEAKCEMGMYIEMMENMREDRVQLELNTTIRNILETNSTRRPTYLRMNTSLVTLNIYIQNTRYNRIHSKVFYETQTWFSLATYRDRKMVKNQQRGLFVYMW